MTESNNVKFVEDNGKWLWKRYDAEGSVIYRSPLFDTERQAREDYEINGGDNDTASAPASDTSAPANAPEAENAPASEQQEQAPEGTAERSAESTAESTVGTAAGESEHREESNDAGSAIF